MSQTYQITGMSCMSCVKKVTAALEGMAETVSVTLNPPRAVLTGDAIAGLDALNTAVAKSGNYALQPVTATVEEKKSWLKTYYPLFLIVGLISLVSFKGAAGLHDWMLHFMAGFFIVFGFFKLLDLKGFSSAYAGYDLLAKKWGFYGFVYPFIELVLGLMFLFEVQLTAALWVSILLMGFGSIGVIQAVRSKKTIRCACLGTALNLPMSTITIVEDLGMVAMALLMLATA